MKQLKKALEAKQAKQAVRNALASKKGAKAVEAFKVDSKHVKKLVTAAIDEIKRSHKGIRDVIVTWKGERPETLEAMKEEIKVQCKAWLKSDGRTIHPQSVYNYQSDLIACCNGYIAYAGMSDAAAKKFDQHHAECTRINQLVKFLRDTKRGKKNARPEPTIKKRMVSAWKNHANETYKKTADMVRYAPTEKLLKLQDFIADLIEARKKGGEEGANVRKLIRKAA